jgi:hypothetical protein
MEFQSAGAIIFLILIFLIGAAIYFIPSIIALLQRKRNLVAIMALNLLLGWSLIGWVVSLVWALTKDPEAPANQANV